MESSWTDPEFVNAPDTAPAKSKFMKHKDIPTDTNMILKYTERFQKEMDDTLRQKMKAAGATVGDIFWVYYFEDLSAELAVAKEYSAFKKMTALTIAMKNAQIEKGDTFTIRRVGEGFDTRFQITKLTGGVAVSAAIASQEADKVIENKSIPF